MTRGLTGCDNHNLETDVLLFEQRKRGMLRLWMKPST